MKTIKLAPDLNEISVSGNVVSTEFNGMRIKYIMCVETIDPEDEEGIKKCLQGCIAMSSKTWQLQWGMDQSVKIDGKSAGRIEVETI